jgi:hypothetical protein
MAGIIVVDRIESDASYASRINVASPVMIANTLSILTNTGSSILTANALGINAASLGFGTVPVAQIPQLTTAKMPTGSVLQVVSATKTDTFTTSSATAVDVTGLSVNITPTSATSKILVLAHIDGGGTLDTAIYINLVRNSTAISVGTGGSSFNSTVGSFNGASNLYTTHPIVFLDSPSTTSSTTYKIQVFAPASSVAVNRRVSDSIVGGSSSITVMEIAA